MSRLRVIEGMVGQGGFAVGPFSFAAEGGTVTALVGPNGGGKTTLLRALAGTLSPRAGWIERPDRTPPAFMPAPGGIDTGLTARRLTALGRAAQAGWSPVLTPVDLAAADRALADVGLAAFADRPFDRLSSGQRQLVMIARLQVQGAAVCLLDEPTALLDPAQAAAVHAAIRALAESGAVVVIATHAIEAALAADQVVTVGGRIEIGTPDAILTAETLSDLYGTPVAACPTCGQAVAIRPQSP